MEDGISEGLQHRHETCCKKGGCCCDNHLSQGQMITQGVNLLVRVSSGEFTRELDKEPLLN